MTLSRSVVARNGDKRRTRAGIVLAEKRRGAIIVKRIDIGGAFDKRGRRHALASFLSSGKYRSGSRQCAGRAAATVYEQAQVDEWDVDLGVRFAIRRRTYLLLIHYLYAWYMVLPGCGGSALQSARR